VGAGQAGWATCIERDGIDRDVAIKVLPGAFSQDPDRLTRSRSQCREGGDILSVGMAARDDSPITSPDDPRLAAMGREEVAGADQITAMLAATPDERLDGLEAMLEFVDEARAALSRTD
jgi:hypothetical protein